MFVSFNSKATGVTSGAGTANSSEVSGLTPVFYGVALLFSVQLFLEYCLFFSTFSFPHCVVCRSSKVWYLQTFLNYTQMIDTTPSGPIV